MGCLMLLLIRWDVMMVIMRIYFEYEKWIVSITLRNIHFNVSFECPTESFSNSNLEVKCLQMLLRGSLIYTFAEFCLSRNLLTTI